MNPKKTTIDLWLEPAVWKWLKSRFPFDGRAYDLGTTDIYKEIVRRLSRRHHLPPVRITTDGCECNRIYVSMREIYRRGQYLNIIDHGELSLIFREQMTREICQYVAMAHIFAGASRASAMEQKLAALDLTDEDIKVETLRKLYSRNYDSFEEQLIFDYQYFNTSKNAQKTTKIV